MRNDILIKVVIEITKIKKI